MLIVIPKTFQESQTDDALLLTSCSPPFRFLQDFIRYFTSYIVGK